MSLFWLVFLCIQTRFVINDATEFGICHKHKNRFDIWTTQPNEWLQTVPQVIWTTFMMLLKGIIHPRMKTLLKCAHPQAIKGVDEFLHKNRFGGISVTSLSHQWILCSEWVPSEWDRIRVRIRKRGICFLQTCSFWLHKTLIDRLEWCGLLWCFYQLFGLSFWRHPFTAEDPLVSKWCNTKFLQICSDEETNSSTSWMAWEWVFSSNFNFWTNYSFQRALFWSLKSLVTKWWQIYHFWMNCSFKLCKCDSQISTMTHTVI